MQRIKWPGDGGQLARYGSGIMLRERRRATATQQNQRAFTEQAIFVVARAVSVNIEFETDYRVIMKEILFTSLVHMPCHCA